MREDSDIQCRVRRLLRLSGLLLAIAALSEPVSAQSVPLFDVDAVTMPDPVTLQPQLDIYVRVPYSSLQFISQSGKFIAQYTVLAELYRVDEDGDQQGVVVSRIWERNVPKLDSYDATQSGTLDYTTHTVSDILPGVYLLEVQIEDGFAGSSYVKQIPVKVRPLSAFASLSDILLADSYNVESKTMVPSVTDVVGNDRGLFTLYYEMAAKEAIKARVTYSVYKLKNSDNARSVKTLLGLGKKEEPVEASVSFEALDLLSLKKGRNPATLSIPLEEFEVGDFAVEITISNADGVALDSVRKIISVRWMGLADQIRDVNEAVEQLTYIAKGRELKWLRSGNTDAEKIRRFQQFWKKRDPTPLSDRNERMEEYYFRIAHANREYGNFSKGWKTDRGQVFVLYGEPDFVERHTYSFGISKPYEKWVYNSFGRRFIFVDRTGVGDYEILIPIWDERNRIR
ncbi:MAG: GWxTD domain-containing protein [Rhodothermia bacterium]